MLNLLKDFVSTCLISLTICFMLPSSAYTENLKPDLIYTGLTERLGASISPCLPPKPWVSPVTLHYQDFLDRPQEVQVRLHPELAAKIEETLQEATNAGLRIARLEPYSFGMDIMQAAYKNISLIAECYVPMLGSTQLVLSINPVQNPIMYPNSSCNIYDSQPCRMNIFPGTAILSTNRTHDFIGKLDEFVPTFEAHGWTYQHHPVPYVLTWGLFTLPIS